MQGEILMNFEYVFAKGLKVSSSALFHHSSGRMAFIIFVFRSYPSFHFFLFLFQIEGCVLINSNEYSKNDYLCASCLDLKFKT